MADCGEVFFAVAELGLGEQTYEYWRYEFVSHVVADTPVINGE